MVKSSPKILADVSYLGPTYLVIEFTNVGTSSAQEVTFSYSLPGISEKTRNFKTPLLKVNETKTIYFQNEDGSPIGGSEIFKETETILQTKISYHNVTDSQLTEETLLVSEQSINLTEFVKQNDQVSVQWEEKSDKRIVRFLEDISRQVRDLSRDFRQTKDIFNNQLHVSRLTMQHSLLLKDLSESIQEEEILKKSEILINGLLLQLMDPYPDLRKETIQELLEKIKNLDTIVYEKVWDYFLSLKWARVEK